MVEKTTVSAKINKTLLKEIRDKKIDISSTIRKSLEEALRQKELDELMQLLHEIQPLIKKVGKEEWTKSIREDRESR